MRNHSADNFRAVSVLNRVSEKSRSRQKQVQTDRPSARNRIYRLDLCAARVKALDTCRVVRAIVKGPWDQRSRAFWKKRMSVANRQVTLPNLAIPVRKRLIEV